MRHFKVVIINIANTATESIDLFVHPWRLCLKP
jgi:hypothetical protein